jgi:hypothetical protein
MKGRVSLGKKPYSKLLPTLQRMAELGIAEYFGIGEALGIIGTLFVVLYFSRKQMQSLSVDIETKVLNDLDEKIHRMAEMLVSKPDLIKLLERDRTTSQPQEVVFAFYILYMCSYAFHMRQRGVLSDNEWAGWLRWMTTAFREGTICEYWKESIEPEKWFDPAFQDFIDNEIISKGKIVAGESK